MINDIVQFVDNADKDIRYLMVGKEVTDVVNLVDSIGSNEDLNFDCSYNLIEFIKGISGIEIDTIKLVGHKFNRGRGINFITWHKLAKSIKTAKRSDISKQAKSSRINHALVKRKDLAQFIIEGIV